MRLRASYLLLTAISGLGLSQVLLAQTPAAEPPSVGDLREEQRIINNAYLERGETFVSKAKEMFADNLLRPSLENGFYAVELLSRARNTLDKHPSRIEQARGFLGRATESTREELRDNLKKNIDPRYFRLQGTLEGLAATLAGKGMRALQDALNAAKTGNVALVQQIMQGAGVTPQGPVDPNAKPIQQVPTELTNAQGVRFVQEADGVRVIPPGTLIKGARLGPNGTIIFANGTTGSINDIKPGPGNSVTITDPQTGRTSVIDPSTGLSSTTTLGNTSYTGTGPGFAVDKNGRRITIGPEWRNGKQEGVSKDYIDMAGGMLDSEAKVVRTIVDSSTNPWKIDESPGEKRNWNFTIRVSDEKKASGSISFRLTVDGGGPTGFTIKSWEVVDASGARAAVAPEAGKPEAIATFTRGGKYDSFAVGETDWGSPFKVKGPVIDAYP